MKFGSLKFDGDNIYGDQTSKRLVNIGDAAELLAIDRLYKRMGINNIERIDYSKILRGEEPIKDYTLLPINFAIVPDGLCNQMLHFPDKIIPVYLGIALMNTNLSIKQLDYLKRFQPIGCRDERTLNYLRAQNIDAYLFGCIAATFPKVNSLENKNTIFFLDVPISVKKYIPKEYMPRIEFVRHEYFQNLTQWGEDSGIAHAAATIKNYQERASLLVTSRFHGAVLGIALGIPTIVTLENNNFKWSWISKYLPIYTPENFCEIDWKGSVANFEPVKTQMLSIACKRIKETYDKYNEIYMLSFLQENVKRDDNSNLLYYKGFLEYSSAHWNQNDSFEYILWGIGLNAENIYQYIRKNYPLIKLKYVYDYYKTQMEFHGILSIRPTPDICMEHKELFTIVTSNSAKYMAREYFGKVRKENYYLCTLDFICPDNL